MSSNPYAAPNANVAEATVAAGNFMPGGRSVGIGHGWSWLGAAWRLVNRQSATWIGLILIAVVIFLVLSFIPFVGPITLALLGPVFAGGVLLGCRALEAGDRLRIGHLFAGFSSGKVGSLMGIGALNLLAQIVIAVVIGLVTGVSMFAMTRGGAAPQGAGVPMAIVLAVLVGLALMIPVTMAVWFASALVTLNERGTIDAMKESFLGCLKNILPFLLYGIVLFGFAILASIPLMLGWLALLPVIGASIYTSYRDIYYSE